MLLPEKETEDESFGNQAISGNLQAGFEVKNLGRPPVGPPF
jgi:hypothetical protein